MSNTTSYRRVIDYRVDVNGSIIDICFRKVVLIVGLGCTKNVSTTALEYVCVQEHNVHASITI